MLMLVIFYRFNIPPQVWNAYALSDVTHRKNYESQVISNMSFISVSEKSNGMRNLNKNYKW